MTGEPVTAKTTTAASPANESSWARYIEIVVQSLRTRLATVVDEDRIRAEVEAGFAAYSQARIRDFVPILVETRARSRLVRAPDS